MSSRAWMIGILATLFAFGIGLSLAEAYRTRDWCGALFSLGPELIGAVVTYALFEVFIGSKAKEEEQRTRLIEETEKEKAQLIQEIGSSVRDVAVSATEKLAERGWLYDGSLQRANLTGANLRRAILSKGDLQSARLLWAQLQGANLAGAKLRGANLLLADLQGAILWSAELHGASLVGARLQAASLAGAKLQGAILWKADLSMATLQGAEYGEDTVLPDGTEWTPDTDMARFTDPEHPDFWRSDDPDLPAYRGEEG